MSSLDEARPPRAQSAWLGSSAHHTITPLDDRCAAGVAARRAAVMVGAGTGPATPGRGAGQSDHGEPAGQTSRMPRIRVGLEQAAGMVFGTNQPHLIPGAPPAGRAAARPGRPLLRSTCNSRPSCCRPASARRRCTSSTRSVPRRRFLPASRIPPEQKAQEAARLQGAIGLAALRMGEQENCLLNHRATSCIFPIDRGGVHTLQGGARRRAIEAFTRRLKPPSRRICDDEVAAEHRLHDRRRVSRTRCRGSG